MNNLTQIKGLGEVSASKLAHLGIHNQDDLLLHLPLKYQNKTTFANLESISPGDEVLLMLKIISTHNAIKQFICTLADDNNNKITWRFFNSIPYISQNLVRGLSVEGFGEIRIGKEGYEMIHPEYLIVRNQKSMLSNTLSPIYPLTGGIAQKNLNKWISFVLDKFNNSNKDSKFKQAINLIHRPNKDDDLTQILNFTHPLQQYLILEELATRKFMMLQARNKIKKQISYNLPSDNLPKIKLDFALTKAQKKVIAEILQDLATTKPMRRLLQGDVGCGKTIVAIIIALAATNAKKQVALMVPTTILAKQHLNNFNNYLAKLGIKIAYLISKQTSGQRNKNLEMIRNDADIIIGTHALIADEVKFRDLALIIIDEQHKFGVEQRIALNNKAKITPHQLLISATPIPRSILMSFYGELDISIIDELPNNRQVIDTRVINLNKKTQLINKINQICAKGEQVYWVCALIDETENYNATPALQTFNQLKQNLPELNIAVIHSKIEKTQKQQIMADFKSGKTNILISTTVIEVGVDVPNASFMVVENAEKMGLATLHQLRGRVGRGKAKSTCVLLYQAPLSDNAKIRLDTLRKTTDGFKIAHKDLELRGAGEILGTSQSGMASFKIANIVRDEHLIDKANNMANLMLKMPKDEQNRFIKRWSNQIISKYITS